MENRNKVTEMYEMQNRNIAMYKKFKGIQVRERFVGKELTEAMYEAQRGSPKFSTEDRFYWSKHIMKTGKLLKQVKKNSLL